MTVFTTWWWKWVSPVLFVLERTCDCACECAHASVWGHLFAHWILCEQQREFRSMCSEMEKGGRKLSWDKNWLLVALFIFSTKLFKICAHFLGHSVLWFRKNYIWKTISVINKAQLHIDEEWRGTLHRSRFVPDTYVNRIGKWFIALGNWVTISLCSTEGSPKLLLFDRLCCFLCLTLCVFIILPRRKHIFYCYSMVVAYRTPLEGQDIIVLEGGGGRGY